jgi:hypothetical protein
MQQPTDHYGMMDPVDGGVADSTMPVVAKSTMPVAPDNRPDNTAVKVGLLALKEDANIA